jgi:hypothetical protein
MGARRPKGGAMREMRATSPPPMWSGKLDRFAKLYKNTVYFIFSDVFIP